MINNYLNTYFGNRKLIEYYCLYYQETREKINEIIRAFGDQLKSENEAALIVDGKSLIYCLTADLRKDFLDVCISCKSIICCRVSPSQKAEVIKHIKIHLSGILMLCHKCRWYSRAMPSANCAVCRVYWPGQIG